MTFTALVIAAATNHIVRGAFTGALTAGSVDFQAFRTWKSVHDAATYNWDTATWRWFQGAVIGAITAAGMFWVA